MLLKMLGVLLTVLPVLLPLLTALLLCVRRKRQPDASKKL